jgi:antagonist of KipI
VKQAGFLTTVQDPGRVGFREVGVSQGGALDRHAMRVANLLVGNDEMAAGLESGVGKVRLRFADERVMAWCGGAFQAHIASCGLPPGRAGLLQAADHFQLESLPGAGRAWVAISGGIAVKPVLGSRSTDLRGHFGGLDGRAVSAGDLLPLGPLSTQARAIAHSLRESRVATWTVPNEWADTAGRKRVLRVVPGADWSRFSQEAQQCFWTEPFTVTIDSDRMGARLEGPVLQRLDGAELLSEAVAPVTIQVPRNGQPILLLADCQTIGGYPKIAHVITVDLPGAAQLQPGDQVRFHAVSLGEAHRLLIERERDLERFRVGLALHTE